MKLIFALLCRVRGNPPEARGEGCADPQEDEGESQSALRWQGWRWDSLLSALKCRSKIYFTIFQGAVLSFHSKGTWLSIPVSHDGEQACNSEPQWNLSFICCHMPEKSLLSHFMTSLEKFISRGQNAVPLNRLLDKMGLLWLSLHPDMSSRVRCCLN